MIDEAKIGGITPAMLSLSGGASSALVDLVADLALRVVDENLAQRTLDDTTNAVTATTRTAMPSTSGIDTPGVELCQRLPDRLGSPRDAGRSAARSRCRARARDLLAQPHQEHRTGDQRHRRDQAEAEARASTRPPALERDRDAERLKEREASVA